MPHLSKAVVHTSEESDKLLEALGYRRIHKHENNSTCRPAEWVINRRAVVREKKTFLADLVFVYFTRGSVHHDLSEI